jgi:hypothetical protein
MNRPVRSTRKIVSYDEAAPPAWIKDPWCKRVKGYLDKWATLTPKERLPLIEPFFESIMSSPECVAFYPTFRDTMTSKLHELAAEARVHGVSLVRLQKRVFHWMKELKKMDCYRATPKYVSKVVVPVVVAPVVAEKLVEPPVMVAEAVVEKVVAPVVVAPVVVPAMVSVVPLAVAEEIAAMVLHKAGALERELADRKRAHEEDMATMLALLTEKDARISQLEGQLQKIADALE